MFNFNADGVNFLYLDFGETVWLLVSLAVLLVLLLVGIALYCFRREYATKYFVYSLVALLAYSMAVVGYHVVVDQSFLVIATIALVVLAIGIGVLVYYKSRNTFSQYIKLALIVLMFYAVFAVGRSLYIGWQNYEQPYEQSLLWITVGVFLVVAIVGVLAIIRRKDDTNSAYAVAMGAICLSICFALSYIRLFKLPQGGSITMASISLLVIYSYMFGAKRGVLVGLVYGVLQSLQDPWVIHPLQYILDYPLAFAMIGLAGMFRGKTKNIATDIILGLLVAVIARYVCHFFSGSIFFGVYGEDFGIFNPWAWGAIYNLFVFADGVIAGVVTVWLLSSQQVRRLVTDNARIIINQA